MTVDKIILSLVSLAITVLGLSGESGSRILAFILLLVCLALFLPPSPKVPASAAAKTKVAHSFFTMLQFGAVAWVSVVGSSWLIADWARSQAQAMAHRSAHQRIADWQDGIRIAPELQPLAIRADRDLRGSFVVHASPTSGTWLVPLETVFDDSVKKSLGTLEMWLGLAGALIFALGIIMQGLLGSVSIVKLRK